jgi:hypothetical protein
VTIAGDVADRNRHGERRCHLRADRGEDSVILVHDGAVEVEHERGDHVVHNARGALWPAGTAIAQVSICRPAAA